MAPKGKKTTDEKESPEAEMKRKFKAKCKFRALGRLVMANTHWLIEAAEQYDGVEDVKRRVAQAVRGKTKKKRLLSITDKALLNKPAAERTESERKYLFRIIGGLKCFKRYPNHVKRKLAAVTYFSYYGPDRVIVREKQEAHALYFIVTGDVIVSHLVFDDLLQQSVSVDIGVMHAGGMFGEVSLLHNIPRTATCTTAGKLGLIEYISKSTLSMNGLDGYLIGQRIDIVATDPTGTGHCELLTLMKEDFKNVLQASVQKQWDDVKTAMSAFSYFDALDEVAQREGCIVAKMKSFEVNEIILGDGVGVPNFVYFILSGRCQMIEQLQVLVNTHLGRTIYKLYDPYVPEEEGEQDLDMKYFAGYKNLNKRTSVSKFGKEKRSSASQPESEPNQTNAADKSTETPQVQNSILNLEVDSKPSDAQKPATSKGSEENQPPLEARESVRFSIELPKQNLQNLRTYFMQVCQFNPGATFGFGENMRDRRIVALTKVDVMMLPKIWLLQRNTANIWSRIQHFLERKIPNKKQLFKEFLVGRRWEEFREHLVEDVLAHSNTVNYTTPHDVPYSIRMEEMIDI